jgi:hypothetical protein
VGAENERRSTATADARDCVWSAGGGFFKPAFDSVCGEPIADRGGDDGLAISFAGGESGIHGRRRNKELKRLQDYGAVE